MTTTHILRAVLHEHLAAEADALPKAVWIPLGPKAADGVREIVRTGRLRTAQVLEGLPHPSGANAERIAYFLGRKKRADLSTKTNPDGIDETKTRLLEQVARLATQTD